MKFHAKINLNGNSIEDLQDTYIALSNAKAAVENARGYLNSRVVHGRNYQHLPMNDADDLLCYDRRNMHEKIGTALVALGELMSALSDMNEEYLDK